MDKLGRTAFSLSPITGNYIPTSPAHVQMLPLGTIVMVRVYRCERPYRIVRWGKHSRKRLQWLPHMDTNDGKADGYLPITQKSHLQYKTKKKPDRLAVRQAFSG